MERLAGWARQSDRLPWALLLAAMAVSATWLMIAGQGLTFLGDDVFYYARFVNDGGDVAPGSGLEYFLAPHNGHLVVLGKLIYRGLFVTVGADYAVFRAVEIATVLLCAGLFFVLARRRVGPWAALIPSVLLLFLGYASESLIWPFNLHTVLALAFGLGALLALERDDRRGDLAACALLVLSVATVELGLAFAVGVAFAVLRRPDRWQRAWIFLIPFVLFGLWWLWARQFDQATFELANVRLIPATLTDALAAAMGSIFGLNPTGAGVPTNQTTVTAWGSVLGALAVVCLVLRIRRGTVPSWLWVTLVAILAYWLMIAMAGRPGDSSRYVFVGVVIVLLVAADALRGAKLGIAALAGAACVVAIAIPPNIAKLYDSRASSLVDADNTRTEYAMIELARGAVAPGYVAATDPRVSAIGGSVFIPLSAGEYLRASDEFGSLAFSLEEVRDESPELRKIADASLAGAMRIELQRSAAAPDPSVCPTSSDGRPGSSVYFPSPRGGVRLGSRSGSPVEVGLSRFSADGPAVGVGTLEPGGWATLAIPPDSAPDRWRVWVDGPVYVCPAEETQG